MTKFIDSLDSWCYNLVPQSSNILSLNDDFLPRYSHTELVSSINSGKVLFLPTEQDKLHVILLLSKKFSVQLNGHSRKRYLVYFADSVERGERMAVFLKKHVDFGVTVLQQSCCLDIPQITFLVCVHHAWKSEKLVENILSDALCVILDDCAFGMMTDHPLKQVTELLLGSAHRQNFNIIGLTSLLIYRDEQLRWSLREDMYSYFVHMERKFKSAIITSIHCNAMEKYLTTVRHKLVKYTLETKRLLKDELLMIDRSLKFMYTLMNKLKRRSNEPINIKDRLRSILQDFDRVFQNYGLLPSFIVARLSRIALEKLKLCCSEDSYYIVVTTIISEFDVISSLFQMCPELSGCTEHDSTIQNHCNVKIIKVWSILSKMDLSKKCVIFVNDTTTAQMLTHVIQKLSCSAQDKNSISIESIVSDPSELVFGTTCEELYKKKTIRKTLKRFLNASIRVLIIPWKLLLNTSAIHADWIFYFDLPPDYTSYIISLKYGNCFENEQYFFVETSDEDPKLQIEPFVNLSTVLNNVLQKKLVTNVDNVRKSFRSSEIPEKLSKKPSISSVFDQAVLHSAIDVVNKYCASLPTDAFSRMSPLWTVEKKNNDVICRLQLPHEPSVRFIIETKPVKDLTMTKRIASLETIKKLKELRLLDEKMLSRVDEVDSDLWCENSLFPLWRNEDDDDYEIGTSKRCRVVPIMFPKWLYDCAPQSGVDCYVHVIHMNPVYELPTSSRKKFFHGLLKSQEEFGIVTRKKLPEICQFPVFTDLGQVDILIKTNVSIQRFTEEEVGKLFSFHKFVFLDVLQVVKGFQIADRSNKENSFFVVPLCVNSSSTLEIAWEVVDCAFMNDIVMPSEDERIHTNYINKNYVGKIVSPWYRTLPPRHYVVTKVLKDIYPSCPFTSDEHESFTAYYSDKYELEVKQPIQPLLEARAITMNLNCIRPRAKTPGIWQKRGEKELDFDEILIPEFCALQPFPAVYWYKSITLPAIAHRLHYVMLAESIRQRVALCGQTSLRSWPADDNDILKVEIDCDSEDEESLKVVTPIASVLKDVKIAKRNRSYPWSDEQTPIDVDRNAKKTCVLELLMEHNFFRKLDNFVDHYSYNVKENCFRENSPSTTKFLPRFLGLECGLSPGPKQGDIYQALTLVTCGDIVNLKFFKIIGQAFLKFASSLLLYRNYNHLNEVQLKRLRGKLIGKRNLFYCGSELELGSYLKIHDVSTEYDWNFGGFSIPQQLKDVITESGIPKEVIFNLDIPYSDQSSGVMSAETRNSLHEKTLNFYNETTREETNFLNAEPSPFHDHNDHVLIYFKKQSVPDKAVVDALKALTGVYLMNCGVEASFEFLQFIRVLKRDISLRTLFAPSSKEPHRKNEGVDTIEDLHNRIFVKRDYVSNPLFAQVFTHHSCYPESSNECNRKLAFLGNTLLDFLITGYIFESRTPDTTIDDLEDIRVALVNDVLFAILSVRIGLHKSLLVQSPSLVEKIDKFVMQQQRVNHKINKDEYLFLVEETSNLDAETADVPKVLSDTFKALIAAIFLDTGDLKIVWHICYNLMQTELDTFMYDTPRNPLKLLYETKLLDGHPEKLVGHGYDSRFRFVQMSLKIDDTNRRYIGIGEDKHQAKMIAAKLAFKDLSKNFTLKQPAHI